MLPRFIEGSERLIDELYVLRITKFVEPNAVGWCDVLLYEPRDATACSLPSIAPEVERHDGWVIERAPDV